MMMIVGKVVDNMAWGHCIPIDSVKSKDDYSNSVHNIRVGEYVDSDKLIRHSWLVRVMLCRVGEI